MIVITTVQKNSSPSSINTLISYIIIKLTSKTEYHIFVLIRESTVKKSFIVNFNQTKIAKEQKVSRATVARVVKKLKDANFIKRIDGLYYINPFIYIPPNINNKDAEEMQNFWSENLK